MLRQEVQYSEMFSSAGRTLKIPGPAGISAEENAMEQGKLKRVSIYDKPLTGFDNIALLVLWPMPMHGTGCLYSRRFFTERVSIGIKWLCCSSFIVGFSCFMTGGIVRRTGLKGLSRI